LRERVSLVAFLFLILVLLDQSPNTDFEKRVDLLSGGNALLQAGLSRMGSTKWDGGNPVFSGIHFVKVQ